MTPRDEVLELVRRGGLLVNICTSTNYSPEVRAEAHKLMRENVDQIFSYGRKKRW